MPSLSSSLSGLGTFDRNEFVICTGAPWCFCAVFVNVRSEGVEEVSRDLRAVFGARRSNLAEDEDRRNCCERCSESVESSLKVTRMAEALRRGSCIELLRTWGSFPFSFLNPGIDVNGGRPEVERFCWIISSRGSWRKN